MSILTYLEQAETTGTATSGFAVDSGHSIATYLVQNPDPFDLQTAVTELLGTTAINLEGTGTGALTRTPPMAHPCFPFQYASEIQNMRGVGKWLKVDANMALEVPSLPFFTFYDQYWISVKYTPRPYAVLPDSYVLPRVGFWYNDSGTPEAFSFVPEWMRYTDFDFAPHDDAISAQQGSMYFNSTFLNTTGGPNGASFPQMPKMPLPTIMLKFKWYQVPFYYITHPNSYITGGTSARGSWFGRVNQNAWNGYNPGQLLYLGYNVRKYTPPIQKDSELYTGVPSTEKLCDIEFNFLLTYRNPVGAGPLTPPTNKNYIVGGHNLQPWLIDKKFYYANTVQGYPAWLSAPFELLFWDPQVDNGV